jgi:hypothetical protein
MKEVNPNKFNLLQTETEPTDEQLSFLMQEVAKEVRARAIEAKSKFQEQLKQQAKEALEQWEKTMK